MRHGGLWIPDVPWGWTHSTTGNTAALQPLDATGEKQALIGEVHWQGEPLTPKTISAGGGGGMFVKLHSGSQVFASGSTLRAGIQDPTPSVFPCEPDGTFAVYADLVGGVDSMTSGLLKQITFTSGSKSIANAQTVCIVMDMTDRLGSDSLVFGAFTLGNTQAVPACRGYTTSWQAAQGSVSPIAILVADDGTLGYLENGFVISDLGSESWQDSTNPDERGNRFIAPYSGLIDKLRLSLALDAATDTLQYDIYSNPLGSPTSLIGGPVAFPPERFAHSSGIRRETSILLPTPAEVDEGDDVGVTIKATGSTALSVATFTLGDAAHGALMFANPTKIHRNGGSGAFTETDTVMMGIFARLVPSAGGGSPPSLLGQAWV